MNRRRWGWFLFASVVITAAAVAGIFFFRDTATDDPVVKTSTTPASGSKPSTPATLDTDALPTLPEAFKEFASVSFAVSDDSGSREFEGCALLAHTRLQTQQGLMRQRNLGGYDAMIFRFDETTSGPFYMKGVSIPLSIAWFGENMKFVSSADMAPCPSGDNCKLYQPKAPYRYAVEVLEGDLDSLGIRGDSTLSLGGPCEP